MKKNEDVWLKCLSSILRRPLEGKGIPVAAHVAEEADRLVEQWAKRFDPLYDANKP